MLKMLLILSAVICAIGLSTPAVLGQTCDVTWTGLGDGILWSDQENWSSDPDLPQTTDAVCHNSGGDEIVFDLAAPTTIASFTVTGGVDGGNRRALRLLTGNVLTVTGDVINDASSPTDYYVITADMSAELHVGGKSDRVRHTIDQGTAAEPTTVEITGDLIMTASTNPDSLIDLTGSYTN